ncbi:MAG: exosome complex RNA-binding protein Csl4 [Candidatus Thorarchaeota archaeon]|nr:exosome complex RNA-binding protein Csl4 [Candidatus Thorarchaeota archaeon]
MNKEEEMVINPMADVKTGDTVVPGDQLCVIEELMAGYGTYEREGVVYSATAGLVSMDFKDRSMNVMGLKGELRLALPVQGDILVGEVVNAYESRAEVMLVKRNGEDAFSPFLGEIRISNVTRRYVKSIRDVLSPGDIVRGVALNTHQIPIQIGLVGPELGVLVAKCSKCGNRLTLTTYNNMFCERCENRETREVAKDYGVMFGLEARQDLAPKRRPYSPGRYDDRRGGGDRRYDDRRPQRGGDRRFDRRDDRREGGRDDRRR